jgi:hypothetical protein
MGIYAGLVLGALALPLSGRADGWIDAQAKWLLLASLAIMAVDWAGPVVGYWDNTWASRVATGGLFGVVAGYLFARALALAFKQAGQPPAGAPSRAVHAP